MKILSLPKHENLTTSKKYCGKEEKLLLRNSFSIFPQYFLYISNVKSPITYKFVKCDCSNYFFLNSENLICRGTDISKCFRESLGIRDNESRLYLCYRICEKFKIHSDTKKAKKLEELSQKFLESPVYEQRRVGKVRRMPLHSQALVPTMVAHLDACPTGDQKAADSVPAGFGNIL